MRANLAGGWIESSLSWNPDPHLDAGLDDCHYDPRLMLLPSDIAAISALGLRGTTSPTAYVPNPVSEYLRRSAIQVIVLLLAFSQSTR